MWESLTCGIMIKLKFVKELQDRINSAHLSKIIV